MGWIGRLRLTYIHYWYCVCLLSHFSRFWLFGTLWTVAFQAPLSVGFSRQEYWSGLPSPPPGDHPDVGIKPESPMSPALGDGFFTTTTTWEALQPCLFNQTITQICPGAELVEESWRLWLGVHYSGKKKVEEPDLRSMERASRLRYQRSYWGQLV